MDPATFWRELTEERRGCSLEAIGVTPDELHRFTHENALVGELGEDSDVRIAPQTHTLASPASPACLSSMHGSRRDLWDSMQGSLLSPPLPLSKACLWFVTPNWICLPCPEKREKVRGRQKAARC